MININISKKLWYSSGERILHSDISIKTGEIVAFYGESGAGKTTMLRILAGLTDADDGKIEINGNIWYDKSSKINFHANKRKVGYVFQDYALFPNMTVKENIRFAQGKQDKKHLDNLLQLFGLELLMDRKPDKLSGGQKQRVALARAIAMKPEILLLDEPLSALDNKTRNSLQNEIKLINKKYGITIILVSHDISEIFKLCSDVYLFKDGNVVEKGAPENLFSNNQISGKVQFVGEVLECKQEDIIKVLTLLVGNTPVKVVIPDPNLNLNVGDKVLVASKAFSPIVQKL